MLEEIQALYDDLTSQQKMIADLILSRTFIPEFRTAKALSDHLNISSSTVVRFAHKIGFKGYPDLSRELHQFFYEENSPMLKIRKSLFDSENPDNPLAQVCLHETENLKNAESLNPPEKITNLVSLFQRGGKILFIGARAAFSLAYYAGFLFNQLEERFSFMNSFADDSFERISRLRSTKDLVFFISFHRYVRQTTLLAKFARESGLTVVALTDTAFSPVAKLADPFLLAPNNAPFFSYINAMAILNALLSSFARGVGKDVREAFEKQNGMLLEKGIFI
jgi:DNA-binding MurR/RpiR family transcriptional regulator